MVRYRVTVSFIGSTSQFVFEVKSESISEVQKYALPHAEKLWTQYVQKKGINVNHATIKTLWIDRMDDLITTKKMMR